MVAQLCTAGAIAKREEEQSSRSGWFEGVKKLDCIVDNMILTTYDYL